MRKSEFRLTFLGFLLASSVFAREDFQPQQIHIAVGDTNEDITITWVTPSDSGSSVVEFGIQDIDTAVNGTSTRFIDDGSEKREMWMHRVLLKGLAPDTRYIYHCGSDYGWSGVYTFKTWKSGTDWPVRAAIYGDLGAVNARSLARLQYEVVHGLYDVVIHAGDFAYDMDTDNARVGDEFMRQIEPIAAYVPYMTCPGNHEYAYNFSNYKARFTMPMYEVSENMYFSWNMGPVHFISLNSEAYYFLEYGQDPLTNFWQWLIQDLEEATKPEVRAERPWIVVFGHRPMYCTNIDFDDCTKKDCVLRIGIDGEYGLEDLLDSYGVDLAIWAHEHSYERLYPMYNFTVMNGSLEEPYTNPMAMVHFITGSAGCDEGHNYFIPGLRPYWSAFRSVHYGYTRLTAYNGTHIYWEQVSEDLDGEVIDSNWLIKDQHIPYKELRATETGNVQEY